MWRTNIHGKCLKIKFLGKYLSLSRISHVQHYTLMNSTVYACCWVCYIDSEIKITIKFTCFIHFQIVSSPNTVIPNNIRNYHINLLFLLHNLIYTDPFSPPNVVEHTNIHRALLIFDTRKCHLIFKYPQVLCAHSILLF